MVRTFTTRNGKLEEITPVVEKPMKDEDAVKSLQECIGNIKDDALTKKLKQQVVETCDEINSQEQLPETTLYKLSSKLHSILGTLVAYTQVIRRGCRFAPLALASIPWDRVLAASTQADNVRKAFSQLLEVATAIAEPILWFYALTALVMIATSRNRTLGWTRLKNVGYAYIGITLLPAIFAFLRWLANILKTAFSQF